jgi:membrane-associated phospholipid phosphatase
VSGLLDQGVELIRWIETIRNPILDTFFLAVTDIGSTVGYLVMLPLVWWGLSWKLGARLSVALVLSVYLNALLKDLIALPRPFVYAHLASLRTPDEYSFPSGHAQSAMVFWGLLAFHFQRRWFTIFAVAMASLIGLSRVYLGAHFPTDVLGGWAVGALILIGFVRWSRPLAGKVRQLSIGPQLGLALAVPSALALLHSSPNGARALGALAGALGGLSVAYHRGLYPSGDRSRSRRAWLVVGLVGLPLLYFGLRRLSPGAESAYYPLYLWARYAAIGLWVSFLVPRIVSLVRKTREA